MRLQWGRASGARRAAGAFSLVRHAIELQWGRASGARRALYCLAAVASHSLASMGPRFRSAEGPLARPVAGHRAGRLQWGRASGARRAETIWVNHTRSGTLQWGRASGARRATSEIDRQIDAIAFNGAALQERG